MILPTKGILPREALLSIGAEILRHLREPKTVSRVWHELTRKRAEVSDDLKETAELTFDWFILALDLLFILGAVELHHGLLQRTITPKETAA